MKWRQQSFRNRIQHSDSEDDPGSWKQKREDARNVYQRPRTKEQTNRDSNTLEGINSRVTEAEEQTSDLEDRMVEITAPEQNIEKIMKNKNKN